MKMLLVAFTFLALNAAAEDSLTDMKRKATEFQAPVWLVPQNTPFIKAQMGYNSHMPYFSQFLNRN